MLELYGVFHLELLEDYIINKIGTGYRIHRTIEFIRKHNMRINFYYEDEDCFYYNLKKSEEIIKIIRFMIIEDSTVTYRDLYNIIENVAKYKKEKIKK